MKISLFLTKDDEPYEPMFKLILGSHHTVSTQFTLPFTLASSLLDCDCIVTTNPALIKLLTLKTKCAIDDYAGSLWLRRDVTNREVAILCILPLKRLVTTKPGKFICKRFLSKVLAPEKWAQVPPFTWELADDLIGYNECFNCLADSDAFSCDIETTPAYEDWEDKRNPRHLITCVSYTAIKFTGDGNGYTLRTFVIPVKDLESLQWVRKINQLEQPKIFQNGKYDNFYFLRFGAPVSNWYFDTLEAHHSLFCELPKNLGYLAAFYIREVAFWKDEGKTGDKFDLYTYNAKDSWGTAIVFLTWLKEAPQWAINNYLIKFPLVFPCLASELDGLLIDQKQLTVQRTQQTAKLSKSLTSLQRKLGNYSFNPGSWKQVVALLHLLGAKDLKSSDEHNLEKAGDRHPINRVLVDAIKDYREAAKLISTYIDAELWGGKLLYTLNPSGTDTGRLASRESSLWGGAQLQNLPAYFKQCIWAEENFFLGEGDFEQSESRCTAYQSGDENLIAAVESPDDFHCKNAANFFGLPFHVIEAEALAAKITNTEHETKRYLVKRVGHGTNYNMQGVMLLQTIGVPLALEAGRLLKLKTKRPIEICNYLISNYHKTYPALQKDFYPAIIAAIRMTKMLVSPLGWTRLCFGTPWNSKPDLNSYIAHVPSNLSVGIINEAFIEIFHKIHLRSNGDFRLKGQIHDSILFSYREGRKDLAEEAKRIMTRPKQITDCKGKTRCLTIPVALKGEARRWTELKKI